jgi:uncharacterized protein YjiS (DUF1127 family)
MRPNHTAAAPCLAGNGRAETPAIGASTFRGSLRARSVAVANWIGRQMEKRRSRMALQEMTDDQLKDIGLSRGQAYSEFRRRLWD